MPLEGLPGKGEVYLPVASIPCGFLNGFDWDCRRETVEETLTASEWKLRLPAAAYVRILPYKYTPKHI